MAEQKTAPLYKACLSFFSRLIELSEDIESIEPHVSAGRDPATVNPALRDDCGRLRVWSENVGAHRTGRVSLDHRLREATKAKQLVLDLLNDLTEALRNGSISIISINVLFLSYTHNQLTFFFVVAIDILDGDSKSSSSEAGSWPSDCSEASISEQDETSAGVPAGSAQGKKTTTRFEEHLTDISHVITCLYKFSIATQNPTPRDRLEKCSSIDVSYFEDFDIQHVVDKFPLATKSDYLTQRLGKANTRRRQLLKYHERHHKKIAGHRIATYSAPDPDSGEIAVTADEGDPEHLEISVDTATVITGTVQTETTVSTYIPRTAESNTVDIDLDEVDTQSEGAFSQTSYASSMGSTENLRVPDPPGEHALDGEPLQCPFCYSLVTIDNRLAWM
jgi:hypothetical protein